MGDVRASRTRENTKDNQTVGVEDRSKGKPVGKMGGGNVIQSAANAAVIELKPMGE